MIFLKSLDWVVGWGPGGPLGPGGPGSPGPGSPGPGGPGEWTPGANYFLPVKGSKFTRLGKFPPSLGQTPRGVRVASASQSNVN